MRSSVTPDMFASRYADVFKGDDALARIEVAGGLTYAWDPTPPTCRTRPISKA